MEKVSSTETSDRFSFIKNVKLKKNHSDECIHTDQFKHHKLHLNLYESSRLFINIRFGCFRSILLRFYPVQKKFRAILIAGKERLDKDFDLLKIIKDIKYLKMLTKFRLKPNLDTKTEINHCLKNVIDLDEILEKQGLHFRRQRHSISGQTAYLKTLHMRNNIDTFIINNRVKKELIKKMKANPNNN